MDGYGGIDRGFRVAHQKISIDVDLTNKWIRGWTELTIIPTDVGLKQITLDCRNSRIENVLINGRKASFEHVDALRNAKMPSSTSVHQHHFYAKQIDGLLRDTLPGELVMQLPKGLKVVPQEDASLASSSLASLSRWVSPDMMICHPLTVKIDFSTYGSTSGFRFVGGADSNLKRQFWHAYTTHDPLGQSTSSWLPCVDGLWELSTWELQVSVPRTVGTPETNKKSDAPENKPTDAMDVDSTNNENPNDLERENENENENENEDDDGDSEESELDIIVVCNNATPSEVSTATPIPLTAGHPTPDSSAARGAAGSGAEPQPPEAMPTPKPSKLTQHRRFIRSTRAKK
ncbi:Taf2p [Sugiyamaella lignohabitans]|uniref:Taf2p n=1 Tax=Sugiyamaella lignohabitans TaxID=796027 RepID=A0A167EIU1_9ASCO|nr:Taf2p [Sugiyamaella lignohabitans]ANB14132.1 Taf2p [Sugiyamaella lignohabitans]